MKKVIISLSILIICILLYKFIYDKPVVFEDGKDFKIITEQDPIQTELSPQKDIVLKRLFGTFNISPAMNYKIAGKVVSVKRYFFDTGANISPMDICLVWGDLAKKDLSKEISFSQMSRYCSITYKENNTYPRDYVISHLSNNHIIPANDNIKNGLNKIKKDDIIYLEGYLVNVSGTLIGNVTFTWNTSYLRTDYDCEVVYVTKLVTDDKIIK